MEDTTFFYRPALKLTTHINFKSLQTSSAPSSVQKVTSMADAARRDLLNAMASDPEKNAPDALGLNKHLETYLSLLAGGLQNDKALQDLIPSSWADTLAVSAKQRTERKDVAYEYGHILINAALWLAKRASYILRQKGLSSAMAETNAKEAYGLLRQSTGMLAHVEKDIVPKLKTRADAFTDLDSKILSSYQTQFLAEAQEIALKRAIEAKQNPELLCSLAGNTASKYQTLTQGLSQQPPSGNNAISKDALEKWRKYAAVKCAFWTAVSRSYQIEMLLNQQPAAASQALKCVEDARLQAKNFEDLAVKNRSQIGSPADQAFHLVSKLVERTASKCHQENVLLHKAKAAAEMPALITQAQFGVAQPIDFSQPAPHALWGDVLPDVPAATSSDKKKDESSCNLM